MSNSRATFEYDQYTERSFAWIVTSSGKYSYTVAEVSQGECDMCGRTVPVLEMDNGEAGPYSGCQECVTRLFELFEKGTNV